MQFNSGREMLNTIIDTDLYNKEKEIYVFEYNYKHSIAYYNIDNKEFWELKKKADECGEYVGALLGPGGWICDDPSCEDFKEDDCSNLDWCNDNYSGEWEKV